MIERQNYLWVKAHLQYMQEIHQLSPATLRRYRFYFRHLLLWADNRPFQDAYQIRPTLPAYITSQPGHSQEQLAPATQKKIIEVSRRFFHWAKKHDPKTFRHLSQEWVESLRPARTPKRSQEHVFVTAEEVIQLATFPIREDDLALRRDQAAVAMLFLSGMRASAFTTLPVSAVNLADRSIRQWPELGVLTKNGKRATTYLLPVPELLNVVRSWDEMIRSRLPSTAPWYAPIDHTWGEQRLSCKDPGKNRNQALTKRLRKLHELAGLPYKSAHKFRHGHAVFGLQHAQSMADYKAVSMNMMHEDIKITDEIYAPILSTEVQLRISRLAASEPDSMDNSIESLIRSLSNHDLSAVMRIVAERLVL